MSARGWCGWFASMGLVVGAMACQSSSDPLEASPPLLTDPSAGAGAAGIQTTSNDGALEAPAQGTAPEQGEPMFAPMAGQVTQDPAGSAPMDLSSAVNAPGQPPQDPAIGSPPPEDAAMAPAAADGMAPEAIAPAREDCGMRAGMRGKTSRSVMVQNAKRTFIAYLPESAQASDSLPFVYVFHGANQTGQYLYDMTTYAELAETEHIAVVFPDGQGVSSSTSISSLTPWNVSSGPPLCGLGTLVSNPNPVDFAFMDAIKEEVLQDQCLDEAHIYSTGFSMGGYFTHHVACERTDIRAAAPHSGGTMADLSSCKTDHMPIIIFHGTADILIAANCDDPKLAPSPGFTASATLWAKKNGCKETYQAIPINGPGGGMGACYLYDECPTDGQVEMCSFTDMGHAWAGSPVCPLCIGEGKLWESATKLQWEFFKQFAW